MTVTRRLALGLLFATVAAAEAAAFVRGQRSGSPPAPPPDPGGFSNITAPAGSLGFTTEPFTPQAGSTYRLAYLSTSSQAQPDSSLYTYRYKATNASDETITIGSIQSGPWYYRMADVDADGVTVGDLSHEFGPVTAA